MTWPLPTRELTDVTALQEEEEEESRRNEDVDAAPVDGGRLLVLQAPGGGRRGPPRPGAYSVSADLKVEGEFLKKAISRIIWLTVSFRNDAPLPTTISIRANGHPATPKPPPPFPMWVFKLENLKGLNLASYPHETLPEEIGNLTKLERFYAYGSALTRLPRSMGRLQNLVELDCYTSYKLHYLPYEITRCPKLVRSRFSTRALYNNYKNRMAVPPLQPWWQTTTMTANDVESGSTPAAAAAAAGAGAGAGAGAAAAAGAAAGAATPDRIGKAVADVLLPLQQIDASFVHQSILPFLQWDTCSVCDQTNQLGLGYHTWSHQVVATDYQCLLAFCCSPQCAAKVDRQLYFDPVSRTNQFLTIDDDNNNKKKKKAAVSKQIQQRSAKKCEKNEEKQASALDKLEKGIKRGNSEETPTTTTTGESFTIEQALLAWGRVATRSSGAQQRQQQQKQKHHHNLFQAYQAWTKEHLGISTTVPGASLSHDVIASTLMSNCSSVMDRLSWDGNINHHVTGNGTRCFMRVIAAGDIRKQPRSTSEAVDRLQIGRIVLADKHSFVERGDKDRQWARLWVSPNGESYWTARTKKNGTPKLEELL